MTTRDTVRTTPIVDLARELAANTNRPMSPDQIKAKYKLDFPFTVKAVALPPATDRPRRCPHNAWVSKIGAILTFEQYVHTKDGRAGYVIAGTECRECHCLGRISRPDFERFVLV